MKVKNIIVTIVVIIILILPKFLIKPINTGVVKKEYDIVASKSGIEWLKEMGNKFTPIEDILRTNNIEFNVDNNGVDYAIISKIVNEPLKDFKFIMAFNVGLKDSKYANEKSEIGRINFTLKKGEKFNISGTPLLVDLMNKVCEQKNYDYSSLDKELNEVVPKIKDINTFTNFNEEVGKYKVQIQIYKNKEGEIHFEWSAKREYETVSDEK